MASSCRDSSNPVRITVFGSARLAETSPEYVEAVRLGRILAERGDTVLSGGYGGLMEAVSRGAREAGGEVIGITMLPWAERLAPNHFLSEERAVETLFARIEALIESDGLIALSGGAGTLGEMALAWNLRQMDLMAHKPVILVGKSWAAMLEAFRRHLVINEADVKLLSIAETIEAAVEVLDRFRDEAAVSSWQG